MYLIIGFYKTIQIIDKHYLIYAVKCLRTLLNFCILCLLDCRKVPQVNMGFIIMGLC